MSDFALWYCVTALLEAALTVNQMIRPEHPAARWFRARAAAPRRDRTLAAIGCVGLVALFGALWPVFLPLDVWTEWRRARVFRERNAAGWHYCPHCGTWVKPGERPYHRAAVGGACVWSTRL